MKKIIFTNNGAGILAATKQEIKGLIEFSALINSFNLDVNDQPIYPQPYKKARHEDTGPIYFPMPNVDGPTLWVVIKFCNEYLKDSNNGDVAPINKPLQSTNFADLVPEYYAHFFTSLNTVQLITLMTAANYLDIPPLLNMCSAKLATMIAGKTQKEIWDIFCPGEEYRKPTREEFRDIVANNNWILATPKRTQPI